MNKKQAKQTKPGKGATVRRYIVEWQAESNSHCKTFPNLPRAQGYAKELTDTAPCVRGEPNGGSVHLDILGPGRAAPRPPRRGVKLPKRYASRSTADAIFLKRKSKQC